MFTTEVDLSLNHRTYQVEGAQLPRLCPLCLPDVRWSTYLHAQKHHTQLAYMLDILDGWTVWYANVIAKTMEGEMSYDAVTTGQKKKKIRVLHTKRTETLYPHTHPPQSRKRNLKCTP